MKLMSQQSCSRKRFFSATILTAGALGLTSPALAQERNPERNAYFGETHLHTSWSVDAWVMGNRITGPDDALKYAQGQTIKHPMGFDIKIDTPLDFMGGLITRSMSASLGKPTRPGRM